MAIAVNGSSEISHDGRVVKKENSKLWVKIISQSACGECHAKGVCAAAEMAEKLIEAICHEDVQVGDEVRVIMAEKLGRLALFYTFFLPFIVMILVLFLTYAFSGSEVMAGLFAIASLVPYYMLVYLSRNKIEKDFVFRAEKKTSI